MSTQLNKRERRAAQLLAHYETCERLGAWLGMQNPDGKKISVALFKLERKAHAAAEASCNGDECHMFQMDEFNQRLNFRDDANASWQMVCRYCEEKVAEVFGLRMTKSGPVIVPGFFVNGDPRGHALKIDNDQPEGQALIEAVKLHTDWGGDGILSPEIDGN